MLSSNQLLFAVTERHVIHNSAHKLLFYIINYIIIMRHYSLSTGKIRKYRPI